MHTILVRNVNEAWYRGVEYLRNAGENEDTRNGPAIVSPVPVTTIYTYPWERVLFCPARDANPYFHMMESAWMLAGQSDARWLDLFVKDFSERFAEPGGHMHGAYGHRWRHNFMHLGPAGEMNARDQLQTIAHMLRNDPSTRQAVLAMWDPHRDLNRPGLKDKPCNTHVYFRAHRYWATVGDDAPTHKLDIMVSCRSNDIVWGAYGANAVHMSVLHEYMAALCGMRQGTMTQVSWNYHAYTDVLDKILTKGILFKNIYDRGIVSSTPLFGDQAETNDVAAELDVWMANPDTYRSSGNKQLFDRLLVPMYRASLAWRAGDINKAEEHTVKIQHEDWRVACLQWLGRRRERRDRILHVAEGTSESVHAGDPSAAGGVPEGAGASEAQGDAAPRENVVHAASGGEAAAE